MFLACHRIFLKNPRPQPILSYRFLFCLFLLLAAVVQDVYSDTMVSGSISSNTTWTPAGSPYVVTDTATVSQGVTLTIEPGSSVQLSADLLTYGTLAAIGTATNLISISGWGSLYIEGGNYSLQATGSLAHCSFTRVYGISASYADFAMSNCFLTNISWMALYASRSRIAVVDNVFSNTGEAFNAYRCAGRIASNNISRINGYADGIDLDYAWDGPGDDTIIIEGNCISYGSDPDADGIDLGTARTIVRNNKISYFGDKGISIGENTGLGLVRNNLIRGCSIGIAVKDGSAPLIDNNTVIECLTGIASYAKYGTTGGRGAVTNTIVWNCGASVTQDGYSQTDIGYCDIEGGWAGPGNIASDPRFVDAANGDYHLQASSPCINTGNNVAWTTNSTDLDGAPRMLGNTVDMGAYEFMRTLTVVVPVFLTEGNGVVVGQGLVCIPSVASSNLVINLSSDDTTELIVPAGVTILAGQTNATFDLTVVNDSDLDGTQDAEITAQALGYPASTAIVHVRDNETATLSVVLPASATEGNTLSGAGRVYVSAPVATNVAVTLTSSDTTELAIPNTVTIPIGGTNAAFDLNPIDDGAFDGPQTATVTAHVDNWTDGSKTMSVLDNTNLTFTLPAAVTEGDGTAQARVSVSGTCLSNVIVSVVSSDTTELQVTNSVVILAGQTSVLFNVTVVDDAVMDGNQSVTVTVSAAGLVGTNKATVVRDNDVHHFDFASIASPQTGGVPFSVTISAEDINGATVTVFNSSARLSAAGAGGSVAIQPTNTTAFVGGIWSGSVTMLGVGSNVRLTATNDASGSGGQSNPFEVRGALISVVPNVLTNIPVIVGGSYVRTLMISNSGNENLIFSISTNSSGINTNGLVLCYTFSTNGGAVAQDLSGNNNAGTVYGGATWITNGVANGGAYSLDGINDYIRTPDAASLDVTNLTVSAWIYVPTLTSIEYMIAEKMPHDYSWEFGLRDYGKIFTRGGSTAMLLTDAPVVPSNQWCHVVGTIDTSGNGKIYVNGSLVKMGSIAPPAITSGGINIGYNSAVASSYFPGMIDEALIYSRVLSSNDIQNLYENPAQGGLPNWLGVQPASAIALPPGGSTNITVTFDATGSVTGDHKEASITITCNDLVTPSVNVPVSMDVWSGPRLSVSLPVTATEGNGVLTGQGTAVISHVQTSNIVVTLASSDTSEVTVPASVTILAGQTSAVFNVTIVNDAELDGPQSVIITASAAGCGNGSATITVLDNETTQLSLALPGSVAENAGGVTGLVTFGAAPSTNILVSLTSSDTTEITVPTNVAVVAGQTSAVFNATIINDTQIDGTQSATVTARVAGWSDAVVVVTVLDNESTNLALTLPASGYEGQVFTNGGLAAISGTLGSNLLVTLVSSDTSEVQLPGTVSIVAGQTSATFNVTLPLDGLLDGTHTGMVTASAAGFGVGTASVQVLDNEGEIRGAKWADLNTNGTWDFGEQGLAGWKIYSDRNLNSQFDNGEPFDVTDSGGNYAFVAGAGSCVVAESPQLNWMQTFPSGSGGLAYSNSLTQLANCYYPNVLTFNFTNAPVPTGDGSLTIHALADLDMTTEYLGIAAEGILSTNVFVNNGLQMQAVTTTVYMAATQLAALASGQIVSFTVTPSAAVNNLGATELRLTLQYPSGGGLHVVTLAPGAVVTNINFGNVATGVMVKVTAPVEAREGDGVLTNGGRVNLLMTAPASDVVVSLISSDTSELTVPASVTILAGQTSAVFNVTIVNDAELDGSQPATITASAAGYGNASAMLTVHDNESTQLSVILPGSVAENAGFATGRVTLAAMPSTNVLISLTSSDTTELAVPSSVTVLAGQTSAVFSATVINDTLIDGTQSATVTAHVANWNDGNVVVAVLDNENTNLTLALPSSATEGNAPVTGRVSISGTLATNLIVSLVSSDTSEATVTNQVVIPAGQTSVTFNVAIVDDTLADGSQTATVTASAAGFSSGNGGIAILDNDAHHFYFTPIASPQAAGVPFGATITAVDSNETPVSAFNGVARLSASGSGGTVPLQPTNTTAFIGGVWTGNVTMLGAGSNVRLTATNDASAGGRSNPFEVRGALISVTPSALTNVLVLPGGGAARTLTISNTGNEDLSFSIATNSSGINTNGLVLCYTFSTNGGTVVQDLSGNNNTGTVYGGATWTTNGRANGGAYSFDRTNDYIAVPDANSLDLRTNFTLSVWIRPDAALYEVFISKHKSTGSNSGYVLYCESANGRFWMQTGDGSTWGQGSLSSPTGTIQAGVWQLITGTLTGSVMRIYKNGVQVGSVSGVNPVAANTNLLYIGKNAETGTEYFDGLMDEVSLYNRALSSNEVLALYENPAQGGLPGWLAIQPTSAVVPPGGSTNITVTFDATGSVTGDYKETSITITCNDLVTPSTNVPVSMDVWPGPKLGVSVPAAATEGNGVLAGQGNISIPQTPTNDLVVSLMSSDTSEVTVPASVTIPAGQTNAVFNITIVDDADLDGSQAAVITASALWCDNGTGTMTVHDNESATLSVGVPPSVSESSGILTNLGQVYVTAPVATNVAVTLTSSDITEVTVTNVVMIPAGQTYASFNLGIIDDAEVDGTKPVTITAHVQNWADGSNSMNVTDNDHAVVVTAGSHGTVNPTGTVVVTHGQNKTFIVSADQYYYIANILTNSASIGGSLGMAFTNYVWNNVTADGTFGATFGENLATNNTPQWWLASYGLTNGGWNANALGDQDNDGMATWKEYIAGTSPTNLTECLWIVQFYPPKTNTVTIVWDTVTGRYYSVIAATNLMTVWNNVSESAYTNLSGTGLPVSYTNSSPTNRLQYLRVKVRKP